MKNEFLRGMCYEPFPKGYDPSTANHTCIFYGSDIASYNMKPLWGPTFSPADGPDSNKTFKGRNDIAQLAGIGVNLIRLYDWDPRNDHIPFLDHCNNFGIRVLVPVSNYNFGIYGNKPPPMKESITNLIKSFSNREGKNYHPAIYGIAFGNELDLAVFKSVSTGVTYNEDIVKYIISYTKQWVEIEQEKGYRKVPLCHPVSFARWHRKSPCYDFWDLIIPSLTDIKDRLILSPNTFNDADYLFDPKGWTDKAYDRYNLPILFTEIGCSRSTRSDYNDVIVKQLEVSSLYAQNKPGRVLGVCYFQYCDKVWIPGTSEGSFGITRNMDETSAVVRYGERDFTHTDGNNCKDQSLNISVLKNNAAFNTVKVIYSGIKYAYDREDDKDYLFR